MSRAVSTLSGPLLDFWTAKADGREARILAPIVLGDRSPPAHEIAGSVCYANAPEHPDRFEPFMPSTMWLDAGRIIDENAIGFRPLSDVEWIAEEYLTAHTGRGDTQLIAACRAFCHAKFGEFVPDEVK